MYWSQQKRSGGQGNESVCFQASVCATEPTNFGREEHIDGHARSLGKTAVVEAWFPEFRNSEYSVRFEIGWYDCPIELTAEPVDDVYLEYAAEKIAAALGYRFKLCREQEEMQ